MSNPYPPFIMSIAVLGVLAFAVVRMLRRPSHGSLAVPEAQLDAARQLVRSIRTRMIIALVVGVVFFVLLCIYRLPEFDWDTWPAPWFGVAQGLAPVVAGVTMLVLLAVFSIPPRDEQMDAVRTADLTPRSWYSAGWARRALPVVVAVAALVLLVIATGVSATVLAAGDGPTFLVTSSSTTVEGAPYPGWSYGLPVLAGVVLLCVLLVVVLRRVAIAPPLSESPELDHELRGSVTDSAITFALVAVVLVIGEFLWVTGSTVSGAATVRTILHPLRAGFCRVDCASLLLVEPTFAFGIVEIAVGVLCVAFALVLVVRTAILSVPKITA
jgi:hypothetical protein